MTKPIQGIVFVHGINQDEKALVGMQMWVEDRLTQFGLIERFRNPDRSLNVWCGKWRSLGDFKRDLLDLAINKVRRDQANADIQKVISDAWKALNKQGTPEQKRGLLVVGHSMGQPLALMAMHGLQEKVPAVQPGTNVPTMRFPCPTSFLSVGGPLGNDDPFVRHYFDHEYDKQPWVRKLVPSKPEALQAWWDVFNPLDPVCHDPLTGSSTYPGSKHMVFRVPGQPQIPLPFTNPIADYHSAYFNHPEIYHHAGQLLDDLVR